MAEKKATNVDVSHMTSKKERFLGRWTYVCCPWKKFKRPGMIDLARWKWNTTNNSNIPNPTELETVLPIYPVDIPKLHQPPSDKIQITWIGHATVLVQFDGISVLCDPLFQDFCGPNIAETFNMAYRRYRKAPCEIMDIPKLDAVVISHNHFDHLEESSVKEIADRIPHVKWFVTLGQREWLIKKGVKDSNIIELDWWEGEEIIIKINGNNFKFICTPAQHWCQRGPVDMNKCLWCSWVIKGPTKSYYFAGDTGYYAPLFKAIGEKYGPFDLAAIPIGAYEPRFITEYQHVDPAEAVKIHKDVKSKQSIGVHWGTFELTNEFFVEPPQKVEEEMKKLDLDPAKFISLCHGETWSVGKDRATPAFMSYKPVATDG